MSWPLKLADKRLAPFEEKYDVTSEYFISEMAAEDLEGSDDEYIHRFVLIEQLCYAI